MTMRKKWRCVMSEVMNFKHNDMSSTAGLNYYDTITSAVPNPIQNIIVVDSSKSIEKPLEVGKYSIFDIANWFLSKGDMTQKKITEALLLCPSMGLCFEKS